MKATVASTKTMTDTEKKDRGALAYYNKAKARWPQVKEENLLFRIVQAAYTAGWNDKGEA